MVMAPLPLSPSTQDLSDGSIVRRSSVGRYGKRYMLARVSVCVLIDFWYSKEKNYFSPLIVLYLRRAYKSAIIFSKHFQILLAITLFLTKCMVGDFACYSFYLVVSMLCGCSNSGWLHLKYLNAHTIVFRLKVDLFRTVSLLYHNY